MQRPGDKRNVFSIAETILKGRGVVKGNNKTERKGQDKKKGKTSQIIRGLVSYAYILGTGN